MLVVSERAGDALWTIMATAVHPGNAMRLSRQTSAGTNGDRHQLAIKLHIVNVAEEGDEVVVAPSGVQLFIDRHLAPLVADRILDSQTDDAGRSVLVLNLH